MDEQKLLDESYLILLKQIVLKKYPIIDDNYNFDLSELKIKIGKDTNKLIEVLKLILEGDLDYTFDNAKNILIIQHAEDIKRKIADFLSSYISLYEKEQLDNPFDKSIYSINVLNDFFIGLLKVYKDKQPKGFILSSDLVNRDLKQYREQNNKLNGIFRIIDYILLLEKNECIKIKDLGVNQDANWYFKLDLIKDLKVGMKQVTAVSNKIDFDERTGTLFFNGKSCDFSPNTLRYFILKTIFSYQFGTFLFKSNIVDVAGGQHHIHSSNRRWLPNTINEINTKLQEEFYFQTPFINHRRSKFWVEKSFSEQT